MSPPTQPPAPISTQTQRLSELAWVFLRLGSIAFGGPAAHIAMIDAEVVTRRQWLSREKLLDLLGVTNLIPGPNSTELVIHIGYERAGWSGLVVAGTCFILPAMLIVWGIASIYDQIQSLESAQWLLYGIKPVILAIVGQAIWNLIPKAIKDVPTGLTALIALGGYLLAWPELLLLIGLGLAVMVSKNWRRGHSATGLLPLGLLMTSQANPLNSPLSSPPSWMQIFGVFLKIGAVLYGSGYVLLAFLQREIVEQNHWLTSQQLLDAVAIGQVTPGPVFTTATFIGYLLGGNLGAIAATVGIFLPAFVLVALVNPWVDKLRQSVWLSGFLDGVNAASLGLMAGVTWVLAQAALVDWLTWILAATSLVILLKFKPNSAWLVLAGGVIGVGVRGLGLV